MAGGAHMADMAMDGKPVCGGDKQVGEYDVGIHVLGLCKLITQAAFLRPYANHTIVLVLAASIFGMESES